MRAVCPKCKRPCARGDLIKRRDTVFSTHKSLYVVAECRNCGHWFPVRKEIFEKKERDRPQKRRN